MTDRILEIADAPARLCAKYDNLVISREGEAEVRIPFSDLAVVIVAHPEVSYTQAVLAGLAEAGGTFVSCNRKYEPVAMLLPVEAHFLQAERYARQAAAPLPRRKQAWKSIVKAKIRAQGGLLEVLSGSEGGLYALEGLIRSGDPANVEARAARVYWPKLLGSEFRRERGAEDLNRHLNYGYAVLRATVARALCGAGLHPSLGVHHRNRHDAFCLADDLMEPFRPLVDRIVVGISRDRGEDCPLDRLARSTLLQVLLDRYSVEGENRSLFDVLSRTSQALARFIVDGAPTFVVPEVAFAPDHP